MPEHQVLYALNRVQRELRKTPATPAAYERGRELASRASARNGGGEATRLPTANQLLTWAKRERAELVERTGDAWTVALVEAELAGLPASAGEARASRARRQRAGMPAHVAQAHYARVNGAWAPRTTLKAFCRDVVPP